MRHLFCLKVTHSRALNFQKYLLSVEEVEEQPADKHKTCVCYNLRPRLGAEPRNTSEEEARNSAKADDTLRQIYRNGVHTHDTERKCPTRPATHIDDVVEQSHHRQRI